MCVKPTSTGDRSKARPSGAKHPIDRGGGGRGGKVSDTQPLEPGVPGTSQGQSSSFKNPLTLTVPFEPEFQASTRESNSLDGEAKTTLSKGINDFKQGHYASNCPASKVLGKRFVKCGPGENTDCVLHSKSVFLESMF